MAKIKYLEVASCKLHMPWFWMNVLSFPLTSLVWLECSSKLVRYIIALCIGIYVVFLQFCYAKLRRLRLNCNCTVTDSETIWRKQLLCCFHTLGSNLFWILISNSFSSDRVVGQLCAAMMSWVWQWVELVVYKKIQSFWSYLQKKAKSFWKILLFLLP